MLVTCICPTMPSRLKWLLETVECFKAQTYAEKQLMLIVDGDFDSMPAWDDPGIVTVQSAGRFVGDKRNAGAAAAAGELVAHFDDDDFSAPERLSDQIKRLIDSDKAVTGYHSMRFTDGTTWWKNTNRPHWAFDTSLCYRKSFWQTHRFDEINDGLEASFRNAAIREKQFVSVDAGEMMYATIHAGNTSRRVIGEGWVEIAAPVACGPHSVTR